MKNKSDDLPRKTELPDYTDVLIHKQRARWKSIIDVQAPYRWNLQRLKPRFVLDLGCGIGRNLINLKGQGVGIDHNPESVKIARERGVTAFTPNEFFVSDFNIPQSFDSILLAHVAEHMTQHEVIDLLAKYLPLLKVGGRLIMITPQEAGFRSDATHVEFMDFPKLRYISKCLKLSTVHEYSFPFPGFVGHFFLYNEFVSICLKPNDVG